jgi:hypothetical protein
MGIKGLRGRSEKPCEKIPSTTIQQGRHPKTCKHSKQVTILARTLQILNKSTSKPQGA